MRTLFAAIAAFDEPCADGQRAEALAALDDIALLLGWAEPMPLVAGTNIVLIVLGMSGGAQW